MDALLACATSDDVYATMEDVVMYCCDDKRARREGKLTKQGDKEIAALKSNLLRVMDERLRAPDFQAIERLANALIDFVRFVVQTHVDDTHERSERMERIESHASVRATTNAKLRALVCARARDASARWRSAFVNAHAISSMDSLREVDWVVKASSTSGANRGSGRSGKDVVVARFALRVAPRACDDDERDDERTIAFDVTREGVDDVVRALSECKRAVASLARDA